MAEPSRKLMRKLNRLFAAAQGFWNVKFALRDRFWLGGYQVEKGTVINRNRDRTLARTGRYWTTQLLYMLVSLVHLWIAARLPHPTRRRATSLCPRQ